MDIALNSNFDIELDDRNDLPTVEGRDAFEQRLAVRTTAYFYQIVGTVGREELLSLVKLQAQRVANDAEGVDRVVQIEARFSDEQHNTVDVTAIYETGDEYTFSVTG